MNNITGVIIALGAVATLLLWFLKDRYSPESIIRRRKEEIAKLKSQISKLEPLTNDYQKNWNEAIHRGDSASERKYFELWVSASEKLGRLNQRIEELRDE